MFAFSKWECMSASEKDHAFGVWRRWWRYKSLCSAVAINRERFQSSSRNLQILNHRDFKYPVGLTTLKVRKPGQSMECYLPGFQLTPSLFVMDFLVASRTMIYMQQTGVFLHGNYFNFQERQFYNNLTGEHEEESPWASFSGALFNLLAPLLAHGL